LAPSVVVVVAVVVVVSLSKTATELEPNKAFPLLAEQQMPNGKLAKPDKD